MNAPYRLGHPFFPINPNQAKRLADKVSENKSLLLETNQRLAHENPELKRLIDMMAPLFSNHSTVPLFDDRNFDFVTASTTTIRVLSELCTPDPMAIPLTPQVHDLARIWFDIPTDENQYTDPNLRNAHIDRIRTTGADYMQEEPDVNAWMQQQWHDRESSILGAVATTSILRMNIIATQL